MQSAKDKGKAKQTVVQKPGKQQKLEEHEQQRQEECKQQKWEERRKEHEH